MLPQDTLGRLLLTILAFVTLFALLPWQPQGPFDARDWSLIEGVSVTMPWWQMLIEPFSALGHILTGAPDFRLAAISLAIWVTLLSWAWVFWRRGDLPWWRRGPWASAVALFAFWCIPSMILFFSHLHFPGWQLQVEDPQWLAADLQSHTLGSHDALVPAEYNLRWHRERGYDVVAITEHDEAGGSFHAQQIALAQGEPLVIPGVEMVNEYGGFLLGLGLKPGQPVLLGRRKDKDYSPRFAENIDQDHQGALISMAWLLSAEDVERLVDDGVDAFELINAGHPDIPDEVRNAMLRLEREGRIRLVSSTDWHGWGGYSRTWTLLRVPAAGRMTPQQREEKIIQLLREGGRDEVIPVAAGYQGEVSTLRVLFSPLIEFARYAAELSPLRLLGWWLWGAILWLLMQRLAGAGIPAASTLCGGGLLAVGLILLWRGWSLHQLQPEGAVVLSDVTEELGLMAMQAAVPLLLVGGWLSFRGLRGVRGAAS